VKKKLRKKNHKKVMDPHHKRLKKNARNQPNDATKKNPMLRIKIQKKHSDLFVLHAKEEVAGQLELKFPYAIEVLLSIFPICKLPRPPRNTHQTKL
jgi:hypothetical protein